MTVIQDDDAARVVVTTQTGRVVVDKLQRQVIRAPGPSIKQVATVSSVVQLKAPGTQGIPGPQGGPGPQGDPGVDGQAGIPEYLDGGNF